jgi:hypothetical protein
MLFVTREGTADAQSLPQPVTARSELAPAVAFALGAACFQAFQTLSNLSLRQNCSKSDARGFETTPVGPDEADNLMHPALDLHVPRQRLRMRLHVRSTSGLTCLVSGFFQTFWLRTPTMPHDGDRNSSCKGVVLKTLPISETATAHQPGLWFTDGPFLDQCPNSIIARMPPVSKPQPHLFNRHQSFVFLAAL